MPAYDAQAVVAPVEIGPAMGRGMLITAAAVVTAASDTAQLIPMLEQAEELTGARAPLTLADGGYHTAATLQAGAQRGDMLVMPERYPVEAQGPYFEDPTTHGCICPQGRRYPSKGSASAMVRLQGLFGSTGPLARCAASAQPAGCAPGIGIPGGRCGLGRRTCSSGSTEPG
jgi:hypothetical protein